LVAPVLQYVPEGDYDRPGYGDKPGVITNPTPTFTKVLESAVRSLEAHGFEDILIIGDSGGNQGGMEAAAEAVNKDWEGTGSKAFALRDYYAVGADNYRAWMLARFGYDQETVGGHAGISDTSQVLAIYPEGIRRSKLAPLGGRPDAGVSGDPTKASAEIGRMGLEFKINAGLAQYRLMKNPPRGRGGRGGRGAPTGP
jgi:creatinine amidohydrolase/Fe(II)-dependent formamide hydrolase-like protein